MRLASNTPIDSHLCNRAPPNLDLEQGQYQDRHGPIDVDESDRISQDVNSGFQVNSEAKQGQPQQHHHLEDPFDHMDLINYDYNMEECDRGSQGQMIVGYDNINGVQPETEALMSNEDFGQQKNQGETNLKHGSANSNFFKNIHEMILKLRKDLIEDKQ